MSSPSLFTTSASAGLIPTPNGALDEAVGPYMRLKVKFERKTKHFRFMTKRVYIGGAIIKFIEMADRGSMTIFEWYPLLLSSSGIGKHRGSISDASVQLSVYWAPDPAGKMEAISKKSKRASPMKVKLKSSEDVAAPVGAGRIVDATSTEKTLSKLLVVIVRAENLLASDFNGKSDPYCIVQCAGEKYRTPTIKANLNPEWNCELEFGGKLTARQVDDEEEVVVRLYDQDLLSKDDPLGEVHIPIWMIADTKEATWFPVEPVAHMYARARRKPLGRLLVRCDYRRGTATFDDMSLHSSLLMRAPTQSLFKLGLYVKDRPVLRVHVASARHIPALDATGFSDPYCVLTCGNEKYKTRACRQTLRPYWGQTFIFGSTKGWISDTDELKIALYDKDRTSSDDLVGVLRLPLWSLRNRWDDLRWYGVNSIFGSSAGEIQLHVEYGSGGKHKRSGMQARRASQIAKEKEIAQVEKWYKGKLWRYRLDLVIISGRDLVVSDRKTLSSDPYCYVSCGKSKRLRTKIKYQTLQPVWGELFKFKKPMDGGDVGLTGRDQVTIEVYDYDEIGNDDFMGKVVIDLSYVIDKMGYIDKAGSTHMEWFALGGGGGKNGKSIHTVNEVPQGANPYGSIHLQFKLVPIAERRTEVVSKLAVSVKKVWMTPGNAENTSIGDKVSLKKAIYAKIEMWDGHSIVLPSRRLYDRLGCASINCEVYVEEDVHKLWKLVKSILDEKEKAALYSRSPKLKGIEGTDTVMRISVHDDSTGRLLGETKYSAEMLKSYKARMDKHSNFMSHGHTRELQGGSTDGRLEAEVRICQVKALMSPSIAYVNIRLESMKVFVNSFKHSFRVVVKCAGHALASQNYGGRLAIDFSDDAISSNVRIPIKSMHSEVEIEVYAKPNRKNDGHLELQGSFVVQRSLHDIESIDADSAIATRHAEKDALKTQNTLVAVEENASSKKTHLGKLWGCYA